MSSELFNALLLGLSSGLSCLTVCSPFVLPFMMAKHRPIKENAVIVAEYLGGRLIAYIAAGAASGLAGVYISELKIPGYVPAIILIITSTLLLLHLLGVSFEQLSMLARFDGVWCRVPFLAGILSGINLCPPFLTAFAYTLQLKSVGLSIVFFLLFFIGTGVYFIPLVFAAAATHFTLVRNAGRIAGLLAAVWFMTSGIVMLFKQ